MEETAAPNRRPVRSRTRLTEQDITLLGFVAEHRIVVAAHVEALLGVKPRTAQARLRALRGLGLIDGRTVWHQRPGCYWATRQGLGLVGKRYAVRPIDPRAYDHDVGVAWLPLLAHTGHWGRMREVVSERQMRSADYGAAASARGIVVGTPDAAAGAGSGDARGSDNGARPASVVDPSTGPIGVRLGGFGPTGQPRLHYPDLLLVTATGRRIGLELEFTPKSKSRLERILSGYAIDRRIDAVLYLTDDPTVTRGVRAAAQRLGLRSLVHVQRVSMDHAPASGAAARAAARVRRAEPRTERSRGLEAGA